MNDSLRYRSAHRGRLARLAGSATVVALAWLLVGEAAALAPTDDGIQAETTAADPVDEEADRARLEASIEAGRRAGGLVRVPGVELPLDIVDSTTTGFQLTWRLGRRTGVGLLLARQSTTLREQPAGAHVADVELDVQHLVGWLRLGTGRVRPELSASVGRTRFATADGGDGQTHPSIGLGVGAHVALTRRLALVGRTRFFATLLGGSGRILCGAAAAPCLRTSNDTVLLQLQASGGISFRF